MGRVCPPCWREGYTLKVFSDVRIAQGEGSQHLKGTSMKNKFLQIGIASLAVLVFSAACSKKRATPVTLKDPKIKPTPVAEVDNRKFVELVGFDYALQIELSKLN